MAVSKFSKNLIKLKCADCNRSNYYTAKNKKTVERKLQFQKYCQKCHAHTKHKEAKLSK